ncbi:HepT-like ribonuclease domain-containing protein [Halarcobacter sp.]|uniref:HepT-like ribonuclease domain-containing protein n=1 Tax=Halarcobacter sp. TaxID=2321133 RepID=UPI002AAC0341|nr:HepT-like ribonuclease domain-containing protein [Halarcobacter sp.]
MSKTKLSLLSIIEAIEKIERYTKEYSNADDFYHSERDFDATMMQFVIIGEMISKIDETFKTQHSNIPWHKIKGFRNIVAHNYFGIDADEIWEIITLKIKPLKKDIENILD